MATTCGAPGCPRLVDRGYCRDHRPSSASRNHHGISPSRRGHGYAYQKRRAELLRPDADGNVPLCVWGCGRVATTADYSVPFSLGGTLDDLVPACSTCNSGRVAFLRRA